MLFRSKFHQGIADGSITRTVRDWTRPQAKVGGRYTVGGILIEVTAMRQAAVCDLTVDDAHTGGFDSLPAMVAELERTARAHLAGGHEVWVIDFHTLGVATPKPVATVTAETVEDVRRRLAAMDARAAAPWTAEFLRLIGARPGTASKFLASEVGIERLAFKADVRKLKSLGLTNSLEVGYELTPLGEAVVKAH